MRCLRDDRQKRTEKENEYNGGMKVFLMSCLSPIEQANQEHRFCHSDVGMTIHMSGDEHVHDKNETKSRDLYQERKDGC